MLLFLDFDGVCHPERSDVDQFFRRSELVLEPWLRQRPDVEVVISSSWRETYSMTEMREFFSDDLKSRFISSTPVFRRDEWAQRDGEPVPEGHEREAEIRRWLHQSAAPSRPWVALDDQPWRFKSSCKTLVVCDGRVGLTERELELVDEVLRSPS